MSCCDIAFWGSRSKLMYFMGRTPPTTSDQPLLTTLFEKVMPDNPRKDWWIDLVHWPRTFRLNMGWSTRIQFGIYIWLGYMVDIIYIHNVQYTTNTGLICIICIYTYIFIYIHIKHIMCMKVEEHWNMFLMRHDALDVACFLTNRGLSKIQQVVCDR